MVVGVIMLTMATIAARQAPRRKEERRKKEKVNLIEFSSFE